MENNEFCNFLNWKEEAWDKLERRCLVLSDRKKYQPAIAEFYEDVLVEMEAVEEELKEDKNESKN